MAHASNSRKRLRQLVIVGGGTAGWMTAAAFAKALIPAGYQVTLVESEAIGTVGVGEATIPTIRAFNSLLGLDEFDFLKHTQGTYKLGIEFVDWGALGSSYIHPFGNIGLAQGPLAFYHYWLRHFLQGNTRTLEDYCVSIKAARALRFAPPVQKPGSWLHHINYAYHFDAGLYARYLRQHAETQGVKRREGKIQQVEQHPDTGDITGLRLDTGEIINGDFFIDCSGFHSLLLGKTLGIDYLDWSHWLPCDSALAVQTQNTQPPRPYTRALAREAGWQWQIPLQHRTGNGYVYASKFTNEESALNRLVNSLEGELISNPRQIHFTAGMRRAFWVGNCVGIGLSSGFLEPLESTSIYLIQTGIAKLINQFPAADFDQQDRDLYNQAIAEEYLSVRDFIVLHYKASQRTDTEFWRYCQAMPIPDSLQQKMDYYQRKGRLILKPNDIFREESWISVLVGQHISPLDCHPLTELKSAEELMLFMQRVKENVQATVDMMPLHSEFIARFCNADKPDN